MVEFQSLGEAQNSPADFAEPFVLTAEVPEVKIFLADSMVFATMAKWGGACPRNRKALADVRASAAMEPLHGQLEAKALFRLAVPKNCPCAKALPDVTRAALERVHLFGYTGGLALAGVEPDYLGSLRLATSGTRGA